jgi:hypothetical protein
VQTAERLCFEQLALPPRTKLKLPSTALLLETFARILDRNSLFVSKPSPSCRPYDALIVLPVAQGMPHPYTEELLIWTDNKVKNALRS